MRVKSGSFILYVFNHQGAVSPKQGWFERELELLTHHPIHPHSCSYYCKLQSTDGKRFDEINSSFAHEESTVNLMEFVRHSQVGDCDCVVNHSHSYQKNYEAQMSAS